MLQRAIYVEEKIFSIRLNLSIPKFAPYRIMEFFRAVMEIIPVNQCPLFIHLAFDNIYSCFKSSYGITIQECISRTSNRDEGINIRKFAMKARLIARSVE
jgi:hypothetical protein